MKQITIRECAFRACQEESYGDKLLFEVIREAFTGERPDWDADDFNEGGLVRLTTYDRALFEAITPDIFASVREEASTKQIVEDICQAFGDTLCYEQGDSRWDAGE